MDTEYYKSKDLPSVTELIKKYNLQLRLDDYGMGTEIFYNGDLVGYWHEWAKGISLTTTNKFGGEQFTFSNWEELCNGIEKIISK